MEKDYIIFGLLIAVLFFGYFWLENKDFSKEKFMEMSNSFHELNRSYTKLQKEYNSLNTDYQQLYTEHDILKKDYDALQIQTYEYLQENFMKDILADVLGLAKYKKICAGAKLYFWDTHPLVRTLPC
ncbi:hypothetical protein CMO83_03460 [Candidatus Woesearchaeota archaeon]|jgi:predicted nuclease with TOPRIM domain|nr:hypothetical protein [Candidatus Woesearchaeota archaeon]|tara:strand:+ start:9018 stop:9398 length:381 start_codon:yes stop_codon:yes gene_type:complete